VGERLPHTLSLDPDPRLVSNEHASADAQG
jgi:hypothetical protein